MLYFPIAPPGSGKSRMAKLLVDNQIIKPEAVVEPDALRKVLTDNRANQDVNYLVFKMVDVIVSERLSRGLDVYLDATNLNYKLRCKFLNKHCRYVDYNVPITVLLSNGPRDLVERRNTDRSYPVPDKVFERMWDQAEALQTKQLLDMYHAQIMTFEELEEKYNLVVESE